MRMSYNGLLSRPSKPMMPVRFRSSALEEHVLIILVDIAGWSSQAARWAHNPKVVGSNPAPATVVLYKR